MKIKAHWYGQQTLANFDALMPKVSVHTVLEDANNSMTTSCQPSEVAAEPKVPAATHAYCWNSAAASSQLWVPQGITTSGDAFTSGEFENDKVILS